MDAAGLGRREIRCLGWAAGVLFLTSPMRRPIFFTLALTKPQVCAPIPITYTYTFLNLEKGRENLLDSMIADHPDALGVEDGTLAPPNLRNLGVQNLLLVLPDCDDGTVLGNFLMQEGFTVEPERFPSVSLQCAIAGQVALVVLDVADPSIDGLEVLRVLRQSCSVPVLAVTDAEDLEKRISALELGADGCVTKPWDPHAMAARIRAILRRSKPRVDGGERRVEHSGVTLDRGSREVYVKGRRVVLTTTEFDILDILMRSAGCPVTRETVTQKLYSRAATGFDRSINVHVSNLRRKLESGRVLIKAVRGTGYQFCLSEPVSAADLAPEADSVVGAALVVGEGAVRLRSAR